MPAANI